MTNKTYQLIDFGAGRKLEQFGSIILDRPSPAAEMSAKASLETWKNADLALPAKPEVNLSPWQVRLEIDPAESLGIEFQLKLTPFGHVGVFPEQLAQWRWLYQLARQLTADHSRSYSALNLFAYTGGSTLALAMAGASVVHVDASAPAVSWARENAQLNGLTEKPIRWIVEDAFKFVTRELRRGNAYDLIVLDPPAYGHSPSGKPWILETQWHELLDGCSALLSRSGSRGRMLWTGHSEQPDPQSIEQALKQMGWWVHSGRSCLFDLSGRSLDAGFFIQASAEQIA